MSRMTIMTNEARLNYLDALDRAIESCARGDCALELAKTRGELRKHLQDAREARYGVFARTSRELIQQVWGSREATLEGMGDLMEPMQGTIVVIGDYDESNFDEGN